MEDKELLKKIQLFFSGFTPRALSKNPCVVEAEHLVDLLNEGEDFVILDVRTPLEQELLAPRLKNVLFIPMHELFKEENLKKIPKDKTVIVLCHTDRRATAVVVALRLLGYGRTFVLKGGIVELARVVGKELYGRLG